MPRRKRESGKRRVLATILITLVCASIILLASSIRINAEPKYATPNSMKGYAQTFISRYDKDLSFFLPPTWQSFPFYARNFTVKTYISSVHGAAVWIDPANVTTYTNADMTLRVEVLFGGNQTVLSRPVQPTNEPSRYIYITGDPSGKSIFIVTAPEFLIVGDHNTVIIQNLVVDVWKPNSPPNWVNQNATYHLLVVSGSNQTSDWSTSLARKYADGAFDNDLYLALNNSESVREEYAQPQLTKLLENVLAKWHNQVMSNGTLPYPYLQKEYDIQQIINVARTQYGISNSTDFIHNLLSYLESVNVPPSKTIFGVTINDPGDWDWATLVGVFPVVWWSLWIVFEHIKSRVSWRGFEVVWRGLQTLVAFLELYLLTTFPRDYPFLSLQTCVALAIAVLGVLFLAIGDRKLSPWFIRKQSERDAREPAGGVA